MLVTAVDIAEFSGDEKAFMTTRETTEYGDLRREVYFTWVYLEKKIKRCSRKRRGVEIVTPNNKLVFEPKFYRSD